MINVYNKLVENIDLEYKKFHANLVPNVSQDIILGVRLPVQRQIAKEICKSDWQNYLEKSEPFYYEEKMIYGLVVATAKMSNKDRYFWLQKFVPIIDNWAVCDSVCSSLKFVNKDKASALNFIKNYLYADREFELRFAVVMLMNYFIDNDNIDYVLYEFNIINHSGYYVKMAVAWAISVAFVKFQEKTLAFLNDNNLDDFTFNKSLQKIIESNRVDKSTKLLIKSMKRK